MRNAREGRSTSAKIGQTLGQTENAASKLAGGRLADNDSSKRTALSAPAGSKGKVSKGGAKPIATAILEPNAWQKVGGTAEAQEYWWNVDTRETSWVDPLAKMTTIKTEKKKKKVHFPPRATKINCVELTIFLRKKTTPGTVFVNPKTVWGGTQSKLTTSFGVCFSWDAPTLDGERPM